MHWNAFISITSISESGGIETLVLKSEYRVGTTHCQLCKVYGIWLSGGRKRYSQSRLHPEAIARVLCFLFFLHGEYFYYPYFFSLQVIVTYP